jgi:hypothetical protein
MRASEKSELEMRLVTTTLALLAVMASAWATTLLKLSTDQMIQQSTSIVRAKVAGSSTGYVGRDIYTTYQLQVTENLKSSSPASLQVAIPGGVVGRYRQMVPGAPSLISGQEYVLFLWTSKSGLTLVMGLSQGLFAVTQDSSGNSILVRPAAIATMLNSAGQQVADQTISMTLAALRTEIQNVRGLGN